MNLALFIAILGAALAAILAGIGSAYGVRITGQAAAGVVSEQPDIYGKLLVLEAMPGTQGIYGFLIAVILLVKVGILGGAPVDFSVAQGLEMFGACMPVGVVGLFSAIYQGQAGVAAIHMVAKQPGSSGSGIIMTALVETYAILALLVSFLLLNGIQLG